MPSVIFLMLAVCQPPSWFFHECIFERFASVSFIHPPVMSRLTVNNVLERVWDDSGDEDDFSGSEDGENDDDYVSESDDTESDGSDSSEAETDGKDSEETGADNSGNGPPPKRQRKRTEAKNRLKT